MNNLTFSPTRHKLAQAVALGILSMAASSVQATNYTFSDLGTFSGAYAGTNSFFTAINNLGQVGGNSVVSPGDVATQAYVWNGGARTQLDGMPGQVAGAGNQVLGMNNVGQIVGMNTDVAGDVLTAVLWDGTTATALEDGGRGGAFGINDLGQSAGAYWQATNHWAAARWDAGSTTPTILNGLGGLDWEALSINNAGQAVGPAFTTDGAAMHAALWNNTTTAIDLGTLGGTNSWANQINNVGQVAGWAVLADDATQHAALWNPGSAAVDLGSLGGTSEAMAINSTGLIVGDSFLADGTTQHATLWNGIGIVDLNSYLSPELIAAGWVMVQATGINDNGAIIGWAENTNLPHAYWLVDGSFVLTPTAVPVPGAVWLFGSALAGFMGMKRRKNGQSA